MDENDHPRGAQGFVALAVTAIGVGKATSGPDHPPPMLARVVTARAHGWRTL